MRDSIRFKPFAFLGGFLPRQCGIATFTENVCEAVASAAPESVCFAVAVNDRAEGYAYPPRVRFELAQEDLDAYRRAAGFLNASHVQVLCVQHEFGIYGGPAGSHLLTLLQEVRMPVVTTLHTVLRDPDGVQRKVMDQLARRSDRLVVMARKGAEILHDTYGVSHAKVDIIPHGIPDLPFVDSSFYKPRFGLDGRIVLLTFGLLGPGKGIEHVIEALPEIVKRHPNVVYLVLGATHPHLVAREGEKYRSGLEALAKERGVTEHVIFHNRFVSQDDLEAFIGAADIYLTPYLHEAQITSGTLAYVFGAGKAVVSTPYWHAQELLAGGRGILVPFRDPQAIAKGVVTYLDDPVRMRAVCVKAYQMGRSMIWPAVGQLYLESFQRVCRERKTGSRPALAQGMIASQPGELPPSPREHGIDLSSAGSRNAG
jgi:glycosyltransferase involved in cell wall biosynthesis